MSLSKLCVHTITTKTWTLPEALDHYCKMGIGGISIWQNAVEEIGLDKARQYLAQHDIDVVSYVRGGFFPSTEESKRKESIDQNKAMIDEAAEIGAPVLVLVCGSDPAQTLRESRNQIRSGIEAILPHSESCGVKLAIEPLHPMYADIRSAINTLGQANDMAEQFNHPCVGVAVDVYHLWWDDRLEEEIARCGRMDNLLAFHICDWKIPTVDMLNDRGLMGEGCIPIKRISRWVEDAGFSGYREVEIFSEHYWSMDQSVFLNMIVESYQNLYEGTSI